MPTGCKSPTKKKELRTSFHHAGLRLTRQRRAIFRELESRGDHPDVECLYKAVKPRIPQISLFTVYRTMNALESAGMVLRVATWKGHARYDGRVESHHHFLCETCGQIDDVEAGVECQDLLAHARSCVKSGHVRRVDVMIRGECAACMASGAPAKQA
jgi:Fur family transcriptional regulator, peroxide stress response regulator